MTKEKLALMLHRIHAVRFGTFTLKSGLISPVYVDLRCLVSYPKELIEVGRAYATMLKKIRYKRMVAVPYAALPIAAAISFVNKKPWIYTRKEQKGYGLNKMIEGLYNKNERIVMIDDLVTTGLSKFEAVKPLTDAGLLIKDVVVLIDRQKKGSNELQNHGLRLHAFITLEEIAHILMKKKKLSLQTYKEVIAFLEA